MTDRDPIADEPCHCGKRVKPGFSECPACLHGELPELIETDAEAIRKAHMATATLLRSLARRAGAGTYLAQFCIQDAAKHERMALPPVQTARASVAARRAE